MTATPTWRINQLERETEDGYVFMAHYTVQLVTPEAAASIYNSIALERPEGELVPYADLTEDTVIGWIQAKLGDEQLESITAALEGQIQEQVNPTKLQGLPWAQP